MTFREDFLATNLSFNEYRFGRDGSGFVPREELLTSLRGAIRSNLESFLDRVAKTQENPAFLAEILYQVQDLEKRVKLADATDKSQELATKKTTADLAATIQSHCDYLGFHFCGIRWAMERYVSERRIKSELSSIEASDRQIFERGARHFELKEYEAARACFLEVLAADLGNCFAHQYLAFIGVHEDNLGEAVSHFELAYKHAPDERQRALALSHMARTQYVLGRLDLAADLGRAATQAFQGYAGLWYESATYASLLGEAIIGLRALTKAMQLDWMYWSLATADPSFEPIRLHLVSLMDGIRQSISQKTRAALDRMAIVFDAVQDALGEEQKSDIQNHRREFEEKYLQNNIYHNREMLLAVEKLKNRYLGAAKETVRHKIELRIRTLRGADTRKQSHITQLREPIERLRGEQQQIRARFKPWEVGFRAYSVMWLAYILITYALLWSMELSDISVIPYLLGFIVPLLVPLIVNPIKRSILVNKPVRQLERRIRVLEREIKPSLSQIELEHVENKIKLERELEELSHMREQLIEVERVDTGVVS